MIQAKGADFRSMPRPGQWSPCRGLPRPDDRTVRQNKRPREQQIPVTVRPAPPQAVERAWWNDKRLKSRWQLRKSDGDLETLYTVGALAEALGKSTVTIRRWIRDGVLPETKLKTAPIEGTPGNSRRRLWTREQIEAICKIGTEHKVVGRRQPSGSELSYFQERVATLWAGKGW